jgi:hypothetical protein
VQVQRFFVLHLHIGETELPVGITFRRERTGQLYK